MALGGVFHSQRKRDPHQPLASLIPDTDHEEALVAVGELFLGDIGQGFLGFAFGRRKVIQFQPGFVGREAVAVVDVEIVTRHCRSCG